MVMAVNARRLYAIEPTEFIELCRYDVFEGFCQPRIEHHRSKSVPKEITRQLLLMLDEPGRNTRTGKRSCEIQMETGINASLPCNGCRSFGILHEHHRAYRRNRAVQDAVQSSVGVLAVSAPVVGVYDEQT
jgi:hypothetical protein